MPREPDSPVDEGRYLSDAIRHLEQAVRLSPGNPRYAALLGEAWLLQGDPEAALAPLQASLHGETHPRIASLLALALIKLDRYEDAEEFASAALEETSAFHRAYFIRAEARAAHGDQAGAVADLRQALELASENPSYRLRLATLLVERQFAGTGEADDMKEAHALLEGAQPEAESGHGPTWRYLRGCVLIELNDPRAALVALDGLDWPSVCEAALRRGYAHVAMSDREAAAAEFRKARVDPELTEVADRWLARVERGPDHEAPTVWAAPKTEMITAMDVVTQLLSSANDTEELSDEIALLEPSSDDPDSGPAMMPTKDAPRTGPSDDHGATPEDDGGS